MRKIYLLSLYAGAVCRSHPRGQVGPCGKADVGFVSTGQVRAATERANLPQPEACAIVDNYATAQLDSLKAAILAAAGITLVGFAFTRHLPADRLTGTAAS
jgi:hypothetical protein